MTILILDIFQHRRRTTERVFGYRFNCRNVQTVTKIHIVCLDLFQANLYNAHITLESILILIK